MSRHLVEADRSGDFGDMPAVDTVLGSPDLERAAGGCGVACTPLCRDSVQALLGVRMTATPLEFVWRFNTVFRPLPFFGSATLHLAVASTCARRDFFAPARTSETLDCARLCAPRLDVPHAIPSDLRSGPDELQACAGEGAGSSPFTSNPEPRCVTTAYWAATFATGGIGTVGGGWHRVNLPHVDQPPPSTRQPARKWGLAR